MNVEKEVRVYTVSKVDILIESKILEETIFGKYTCQWNCHLNNKNKYNTSIT